MAENPYFDTEDSTRDYSDDGLSLQFVDRFENTLRYAPITRTWYIWSKTRWIVDNGNGARHCCSRMIRAICLRIQRNISDALRKAADLDETPEAKALRLEKAKYQSKIAAKPLKSVRTWKAILEMAASDPRIVIVPDQLDGAASRMLLNTPKGTIDLTTGVLREPQQTDYITKMTKIVAKDIPTPHWNKFLNDATRGDAELIKYLQRVFGYCLTGDTSEQTLFFCHGTTETGKSVITNAVSYAMGEYRADTAEGTFSEHERERHTQEIARLVGARFVTSQETKQGSRWAATRIKRLTGQDKITARLMRQNDFEFTPQMKIFIVGNFKPAISSMDEAIRRRFHLIPITNRVKERDPKLGDKLELEASGILHWMVQGCLMWQKEGLNPPRAVVEATDKYMAEEDDVGQFIEECCERDEDSWVGTTEIFLSWKRFARANEIPLQELGDRTQFSNHLDNRSTEFRIRRVRKSTGQGFAGLRLIPSPQSHTGNETAH